MAADPQSLSPAAPPGQAGILPFLRLSLAWLLTLVVLPYTWGRTLVMWMVVGRPEAVPVGLLAVAVLGGILLTFGLSAAFAGRRWARLVGWAVAVPWVVVNGVLVGLFCGPLLPWVYVVPLFIPATFWVVWLVWMFYRPLRWPVRLGVLALCLAALAGSLSVVRAEGLTGAAQVDFTWRWQRLERTVGEITAAETTAAEAGAVQTAPPGERDFAQFLGPFRSAVLPDAHLARDWEKSRPRLVWRKPVGAGWGAFAMAGDRAITQEQRGPDECVVCYRLSDGARLWLHADPVRFDSSMGGPGPRATPTIDGGRVYTVGATGLLNCLDAATGRRVWSADILKDHHADNVSHGVCGSPLLVDDLVVVCPTGVNGPSLAAYQRDTGRHVWQAGSEQAGYSSPVLTELAGVRQIVLYTSQSVTAHDPGTGKVLWTFPWSNGQQVNCSQPIPNAGGPGQVFVSTGYGKGSALFQVEHAADGSWSVRPLWSSPFLKTKFTTAVLYQGHLYGLDEGILECLDVKSGKKRWKDGRYQHGQILLAGDLLLVQAEDGAVVLVAPDPAGLRELGRLPALEGKTWNNPALAGRFLLVRNDREAACYALPLESD